MFNVLNLEDNLHMFLILVFQNKCLDCILCMKSDLRLNCNSLFYINLFFILSYLYLYIYRLIFSDSKLKKKFQFDWKYNELVSLIPASIINNENLPYGHNLH